MALDNVLIAQIISLLNSGFSALSAQVPIAPVVAQSFQPTQQGANSAPSLYLYKLNDVRIGFPQRSYVWDEDAGKETATTLQQYGTPFQLSAWVTQNPANTTSLTASDYANYAAFIMQSDATIAALEAQGRGILNISQVRNPSIVDDRDRFEFAPSFDFTITHKQIIQLTAPIIISTELHVMNV